MDAVKQLKTRAKKSFESQDYVSCLGLFKQLIELEPDNARNWLRVASNLRNLGRHSEAVEHCRKAIALDPEEPLAFVCIARSQAELGLVDEAIGSCGKATHLAPGFVKSYNLRATAFMAKGVQELSLVAECLRCARIKEKRSHGRRAVEFFNQAVSDLSTAQAMGSDCTETIELLLDTIRDVERGGGHEAAALEALPRLRQAGES